MLRNFPRLQAGVSLVELMIGSAIGLIVIGGVVAMYATTVKSGGDSLKAARLDQELRAVMEIMNRDIRRAGYLGVDPEDTDIATAGDPEAAYIAALTGNPFMQAGNDITVSAATGETANSCITYSYDLNGNRTVGVGSGTAGTGEDSGTIVEQFGFRLQQGAIDMRSGRSGGGDTTFTCNSGTWEAITDSAIQITGLTFTLSTTTNNLSSPGNACGSGNTCQDVREVAIVLSGELSGDASVSETISSTVKIRNDRYYLMP